MLVMYLWITIVVLCLVIMCGHVDVEHYNYVAMLFMLVVWGHVAVDHYKTGFEFMGKKQFRVFFSFENISFY